METNVPDYIAFEGDKRIAAGPLSKVAVKVKQVREARPETRILIFHAASSEQIDLDLRGTEAEMLSRLPATDAETPEPTDSAPPEPPVAAGPGRPKLGVVAREVTLLPRHWDWLKSQPGGASVALRKLVEQARRANAAADRVRLAQNGSFKFMSTMAGNFADFEEATRALFAADAERFEALTAIWPVDIRDHLRHLAAAAFEVIAPEGEQA